MTEDQLSLIAQDSVLTAPVKMKPFNNIMVSISGGSDSDIVIDLVLRSIEDRSKVHFVFFDTGIEYQATKNHLDYLEEKYGVHIERARPEKPIPLCSLEFGQPFLSKEVSEYMMRLQKHGFQWEDDTFENLIVKYPKCRSALKWWCNENSRGSDTRFCISRNKLLKEFIIANPPTFRISNKCCYYAKKKVATQYKKEHAIDLNVTGMRKAEGGIRANTISSCFTQKDGGISEYRPIWWYSNEDKTTYEEAFNIIHSDCYTVYGFNRTGCAGCPINREFDSVLEVIQEYEPKLYKAVNKVFGDSYEYTRKYREFVANKS